MIQMTFDLDTKQHHLIKIRTTYFLVLSAAESKQDATASPTALSLRIHPQ